MSAAYKEFIAHKLQLAEDLAQGCCGGTYSDACIILASVLSGIAADLWPGKGKDRRRFVETWVRYRDGDPSALRVSLPLLVRRLERDNRNDEAERIRLIRRDAFRAARGDALLLGAEIDADESEVLKACPMLKIREIRDRSYPSIFYDHVRSTLVHEYDLNNRASGSKLTRRDDSVSYASTGEDGKLQIHFHVDWLIRFVRRVGDLASTDVNADSILQDPVHWWSIGDV